MNNKKKISALILLASMLIPYSTAIASPNSGLTEVMDITSSISYEGGDVDFTLKGTNLVEKDIKAYVILKDDEMKPNKKRLVDIENSLKFKKETTNDTSIKKLTLHFPKNEYNKSQDYIIRFSVDGTESQIYRDYQKVLKIRKNTKGIDKPSTSQQSEEEFEVTEFTNNETTTKGKYDFTVKGKKLDTNKLKVKVLYEFEMNGIKTYTGDDNLTKAVKLSKKGEDIKFTIDFPTNEDKKYKVELFNGYAKLNKDLIIEVKKSNIEKPVTPTQETTLNSVDCTKDGLKYTFSIKGTNLDIYKIKVKKVILKENGRPINQTDLVYKIKLEKVSDKELKATLLFPETKEDKEYKVSFGLDQADKKTVACKVTKDDKAPKEEEIITPLNPTTTKGKITKVSLIGVNESYQASFTITGLNLSNDNMKVKVLEGMKERTDIEKTFENLATKTTAMPSLNFKKEDKGKTFKVYFNADASNNFEEKNSVSFKIESKNNLDPDPTVDHNVDEPTRGDMKITELKANNPSLDKNGGIAKVTVKGENLDSKNLNAEIYKLINGKEEKIDKKVEFVGTDKLQSASITFEKVEKEETYIVKLNDKSCKITVGGKKSLDTVSVVPDVCYLNNQKNKLTVKLFAPVTLTVSEKEFKDAITIDSKKLTDEDKVSLLGKNIIIELKNELTVKANSKIEFKERLFKNENNEENKAFWARIQNAIPYGSSLEFVEGQVLSKSGGKVKLKFTGENLKDNVKVKVLKSDKQRTKVATTEDGGGVTVIKKNDNEQEISFNLPENKGKISESYTILVSVDGGRKYMSDYGANVLKSEKEKTTVATVLADETINNKPTLSFMSITSYGTEGGGTNEPDITITHTPVGQASKKTWISLYGANLDEGLTKVKVIDQNGVEWYPIENEGTTDSMDNFLMVMKNNKGRFGIFGDGTSQKIELICPRNIRLMGEGDKSPKYKILVAVDGINYNQEITVTAVVTDDGDSGKEILSEDKVKEVSVSYETENGEKVIESKKVKGYEWSKLRSFNIRAVEKDGYKLQGVKINDNNELKPISFLNEAKIYDSSSKTLIKNVKFIYEKTKKDNENPTTTPSINPNHNTSSDDNENLKDTIKFIFGENQKIKLNSNENLIFKMDANVKDFINVYVDEHLVDKSIYTVKKGSTIITFNKEFIKTLKEGSHDIKFEFKNGLAKTKLLVEKNKSKVPLKNKDEKEKNNQQQNLPKTSITLTNVLTSLILSSVGVFTSLKKRK